ncbi:MAG: uncharacterized membrane protein YkvA (DUF1232 family) [Gammaproteobacteria bacterium]|jgi:uncharacterized membrane protein YkvA (DUF1232 family)
MVILEKFRQKGREIKSNAFMLYRSLGDPRIPWYVKIMAMLIVAYIISPIDLIPDFIPILGLLDEIILVPIFLSLTIKMIPVELQEEYKRSSLLEIKDKRLTIIGTVMILTVWIVFLSLCVKIIT